MAAGSKLLLKTIKGTSRIAIKNKCHQYMAKFEDKHTKMKAMLFGNLNVCRHLYPAEVFSKSLKMQFENDSFSVPAGYDTYLMQYYGDYMKMPPIEEQGVKLDHIVKVSTDEPYEKFKGILYCVKNAVGVLKGLNSFLAHLLEIKTLSLYPNANGAYVQEVCA